MGLSAMLAGRDFAQPPSPGLGAFARNACLPLAGYSMSGSFVACARKDVASVKTLRVIRPKPYRKPQTPLCYLERLR